MSRKKFPASSRHIAATALCTLYQQKLPVKQILEDFYNKENPSIADRSLIMNIVFGVLRNRQSIDIILRKMSSVRLKKIQPFVHQSLAVALYQIFFLDSIPESAAVNEAVKSCQKAGVPKRLHGFVNGILRNSLRQKEALETILEENKKNVTNHPEWLIESWREQFGDDICKEIVEVNNTEANFFIRINSSRINRDEYIGLLKEENISSQIGIAPDALIIEQYRGNPNTLPGYDDGLFQVQDQAAQIASLLLGKIEDGLYLDACAGLGGKTSHIASLAAGENVEIIALEPDKGRREKFAANMERLQLPCKPQVIANTIQEYRKDNEKKINKIIVDAPCSGTGVIRRHPDIRWNRNSEDILKNQNLQLEILATASELLAENGILVYATCSLQRQENYEVIEQFLEINKNFKLDKIANLLPSEASKYMVTNELGEFFAPKPCAEMDGFFGARLIKKK